MNFYEITNGFNGDSYVRVYAWAKTKEEALEMAKNSYLNDEYSKRNPRYANRLEIKLLFSSSDKPFCTKPSSDGFEV